MYWQRIVKSFLVSLAKSTSFGGSLNDSHFRGEAELPHTGDYLILPKTANSAIVV